MENNDLDLDNRKMSLTQQQILTHFFIHVTRTQAQLHTVLQNQSRIIAKLEERPEKEVWNEIMNQMDKNQNDINETTFSELGAK